MNYKFRVVLMVQFNKNAHNPSSFCGDMVTPGVGDLFDQSMLAQSF